MKNSIWRVIGVMSGTSLDGVDLVFVKFKKGKAYSFEILKAKTVKYSQIWKNKLKAAFDLSGEKLVKLDAEYAELLSEIINDFIAENRLSDIDFIASHGHTVFHNPQEAYTLQIGNGAVIAAETGVDVICDFRKQDVALGGQGAPLVPIGDKLLFSAYDFCLNLGGFSNISFDKDGVRRAFDISPVNIVLNHYTRQIGLEYDDRGKLASNGNVVKNLLNELDALDFYHNDEPKSLGYEFVVAEFFPLIDKYKLDTRDILCTVTEHAARQIARVLNANIAERELARVLITGGGAFNDYLIERIRALSRVEIVIPDRQTIDFKEALIFAFLGVLKNLEEVNCLKSVTGARKNHSSGVVYKH